jgi:DnaJ-class molecular chaperone
VARRTDKDYYAILGIGPDASEEEIKRAFRKKALELHPDRNPGNPESEERFKEVTEAYGVLIDPTKRSQYDSWRRSGFDPRQTGGFDYRPEDIFRDIFAGPGGAVFQELVREFARQGLRFDKPFVNRVFFPGFQGVFFGGVFVGRFSPFNIFRLLLHGPPRQADAQRLEDKPRKGLFSSLRRALSGAGEEVADTQRGGDLTYHLVITAEEALQGAEKTILIRAEDRDDKLNVKIPAGVRDGQKLRLRGKGHLGARGAPPGDCYIALTITD